MQEHGTSWPEFRSMPISRERLEALLIEIRNGASLAITGLSAEQAKALSAGEKVTGLDPPGDAVKADVRAVWHAAEVALGILRPDYVPKRVKAFDWGLRGGSEADLRRDVW